MQTPYIIIDKRWPEFIEPAPIENRRLERFETDYHLFLFYPPDDDFLVAGFRDRVYSHCNSLRYEDGFMLKYPFGYISRAEDKLELFMAPSIELDGFFSRIIADDNKVVIDGSGTYLQTLCSHQSIDRLAFSNNLQLMEDVLKTNQVELEPNIDFFANHIFNYSLAYYASAGTPWKQIRFHDSLETIQLDQTIETKLKNKFDHKEFSALKREERTSLLYKKIKHCLGEYCRHIGVDIVGHNLTGGRDSRTSLSLFMQEVRDKIEIVTGGFNYTHDRVISNHVSQRFNMRARETDEIPSSTEYDYKSVMEKSDLAEWMIPMFRKKHFTTHFEKETMVANGYLGNVITFDGNERNQIILDNRFHMESCAERRMRENYDKKIAHLKSVYGERAFSMFNLMYNTTNKIASVCRRLKQHTFCIFESDFFQLCYGLEDEFQRKAGSLHYDLMRLSEPELLTTVPFETNKSFEGMADTFELSGFKEVGSPRPYKSFLEQNLSKIIEHLISNCKHLPFLSSSFFELVQSMKNRELPPLLTNKVYAALGTLEFLDIPLTDIEIHAEGEVENHYSMKFFDGMYLEPQIWASGLPGMVYQKTVVFKTCVIFPDHVNLRVMIREAISYEIVPCETERLSDGFLTTIQLPESGKYRVNFSTYDTMKRVVSQKFKTSFVAKYTYSPTEMQKEERIVSIPEALS